MTQRTLRITNIIGGAPISGVCTACGAMFRLDSDKVEPSSAQNELEQKFAKHKCEGKI